MNLEEAAETSTQYENKVKACYDESLEAKQTTSSFCEHMVQELDAAGRRLFERFVEIEEGHLGFVQAELSAVSGLGVRFDMKEFDLSGA